MSDSRKCEKCGNSLAWIDCIECDEGLSGHDCGEDCCVCADPEPNEICDACKGQGGWWVCLDCADPEFIKQAELDGRVAWPE